MTAGDKQAGKMLPVSVVIPCYRCGGTIGRAVDSVACQTAVPGEVILVDDFSNDGTLEQLEMLSGNYSEGWIRIVSLQSNGGPGVARNEGIRLATQPYIAFLDADDTWHPQKAEMQYEWMREHPSVMLTGHASVRFSAQAVARRFPFASRARAVSPSRLLLSNVFSSRSIMFRRELPVKFDREKRYMEDHWWLMQAAFAGCSMVDLNLPLAFTYKADYGEGGLSGKLWKMEKAELDNYWRLGDLGKVHRLNAFALCVYSLAKYARRLVVSYWRRSFRTQENG